MSHVEYTIRALKMGQSDVPGPEVYWMEAWERWEKLRLLEDEDEVLPGITTFWAGCTTARPWRYASTPPEAR